LRSSSKEFDFLVDSGAESITFS